MSYSTIHAPGAVLDYIIDFSEAMDDVEDLVGAVVTGAGITVDSSLISGKRVIAILSGGVENKTATVKYRVTTDSVPPRTFVETLVLKILSPPVAISSR